jgi:1-acyl-sn-glycerol-3-phosphate acyltransferase
VATHDADDTLTPTRLTLEPDPRRTLVIQLVRLILLGIFDVRVHGVANVPKSGAVLLVANHQSIADSFLLYVFVPRRVRFMAKEELFLGRWRRLARWFGGFPVRRGRSDRQALKTALDLLADGECVGMYPEGSRSETGQLQRAYPGAGLLGVRSNATIVPAAIVGTGRLRTWTSFLRRPEIHLTVGQPFHVVRPDDRRVSFGAAADEMMERIAALLPPQMQGVYAEPVPTTPSRATIRPLR